MPKIVIAAEFDSVAEAREFLKDRSGGTQTQSVQAPFVAALIRR